MGKRRGRYGIENRLRRLTMGKNLKHLTKYMYKMLRQGSIPQLFVTITMSQTLQGIIRFGCNVIKDNRNKSFAT